MTALCTSYLVLQANSCLGYPKPTLVYLVLLESWPVNKPFYESIQSIFLKDQVRNKFRQFVLYSRFYWVPVQVLTGKFLDSGVSLAPAGPPPTSELLRPGSFTARWTPKSKQS